MQPPVISISDVDMLLLAERDAVGMMLCLHYLTNIAWFLSCQSAKRDSVCIKRLWFTSILCELLLSAITVLLILKAPLQLSVRATHRYRVIDRH